VGGRGEPIEAAYQVAGDAQPSAVLVPLQTMVEELRGLADQLAELARRNEGLALEVGTLRERVAGHEGQLAAKDETIAELRRQAGLAEAIEALHEPVVAELRHRVAERDRALAEVQRRADVAEQEAVALRARLSPPVVAQDATAGADSTTEASAPLAPAAGRWARLGRWWRGEA
jgi:chromosome segregation ATPase